MNSAPLPDPELAKAWRQAQERWFSHGWRELLSNTQNSALSRAGSGFLAGLARHRENWEALDRDYRTRWAQLYGDFLEGRPLPDPAADPRFKAEPWRELPYFRFLAAAYHLTAEWLWALAECAQPQGEERQRLFFWLGQWIDAAAPGNFLPTNPEALGLAFETQGISLRRGLEQLAEDSAAGRIALSDPAAFRVGENLAVTPGAVVYQNDLIQLIQYRPATQWVFKRPLLIVPPFINKYYILDLQAHDSFVRYAVEQGHTVFMISWRNISQGHGHHTWDDYLEHGVMQAIEVALKIAGTRRLDTLGFCVGGTLLACALAVLAGKRRQSAASLTLLASLLDFSEPGPIGVYIDEGFVAACEAEFGKGGIVPGNRLAWAFSSLRASDLLWSPAIRRYLKGQPSPAFDLLHWNGDAANLSGPMYCYYLRNLYLENRLREHGTLAMSGVPLDLRQVALPTFVLAAREDHIVPWTSAYAGAALLGGDKQFVLSSSGHVAGVVNPPENSKRVYWTGQSFCLSPQAWWEQARQQQGSWWPHWSGWLKRQQGGKRIPARCMLGSRQYPEREMAPGSYVLQRAE